MKNNTQASGRADALPPPTSVCIDWYAEGQGRSVEVNGIRVLVRFVGRKGRRGRIAIEAPAGAEFIQHRYQSEEIDLLPLEEPTEGSLDRNSCRLGTDFLDDPQHDELGSS